MKGKIIVLEGFDGAGKSTQIVMLKDYLRSRGQSVVCLREPGTTEIGMAIRQVIKSPAYIGCTELTQLLLFSAARAELVARTIRPALDAGSIVLLDRFYPSTIVYQGLLHAKPDSDWVKTIVEVTERVVAGASVDLGILIDIPAETAGRDDGEDTTITLHVKERLRLEYNRYWNDGCALFPSLHRNTTFKTVDGLPSAQAVGAAIAETACEFLHLA